MKERIIIGTDGRKYITTEPQIKQRTGDCLLTGVCAAEGHSIQKPKREWQGLTDEEVRDLWSWAMTAEAERTANTQQHAFARAIEAKLKEKNT